MSKCRFSISSLWQDQETLAPVHEQTPLQKNLALCLVESATTNNTSLSQSPCTLSLKILDLSPDQTNWVEPMNKLVLLADDNEKVRRALARVLEEEGYTIVEAASGKEALSHLNSSTEFDLLITDLAMPDMDGLQVLTEVKRTDPDLPVIAMSGAFSGRLLKFATTFGVPTLEKPFRVPALVNAVESALRSKTSPAA